MPGFVPESVLKKRRTAEEIAAKKAAEAKDAEKKDKSNKKEMLKRAETYVDEYKTVRRSFRPHPCSAVPR